MTSAEASSQPSWSDVLDLVRALDASGLADAEVVTGDLRVRVSRHRLSEAEGGRGGTSAVAEPTVASSPATEKSDPRRSVETTSVGDAEIAAPMLGILYHRPAPDAAPFVAVGDQVSAETTVAIIEVMKLMNPVSAGVAGVITEVCVEDAAMVEHGDVLFRVRTQP